MIERKFKMVFLAIAVAIVTLFFATQNSTAQRQDATESNHSSRFQISAFAYPSSVQSPEPMYGAYIVDSVTGKVWLTLKTKSPNEIGRIE